MIKTKKIWPKFFREILYGKKRFEIRKDEDRFEVDDCVVLAEWDPETEKYTGRKLYCYIDYIFRSDYYQKDFGLKPGYCIIGFSNVIFEQEENQ